MTETKTSSIDPKDVEIEKLKSENRYLRRVKNRQEKTIAKLIDRKANDVRD